jgi:hypothetical protein
MSRGFLGKHHSEKTKRKISLKSKKSKNANWKGGKKTHNGYIYRYVQNHPFKINGRYVFEHRLIMEQWLRENEPNHPALIEIDGKKYLQKGWAVHHINWKKNDNWIENLELMTHSEHSCLLKGSKNPMFGKKLSKERRRKMSIAKSGKNHPFYGKHLTEAHRKKLSELRKGERNPFFGKHHTDKWKRDKSLMEVGSKNPMFGVKRTDIIRDGFGRFVGKCENAELNGK